MSTYYLEDVCLGTISNIVLYFQNHWPQILWYEYCILETVIFTKFMSRILMKPHYNYYYMSTCFFEGFWLLHSHLGHHQSQGMALVLQEGDNGDMVRTPPNFPTCGSFQTSKEQIEKAISVYKKILIAREAGSSFGKYTCFRQLSLELLNHFIDILA